MDCEVDFGREDLVPAVDGMDEVSTAFEAAGAAEGVGERGVGGEVGVNGGCLLVWGGLGKFVDYSGYILDGIVHCVGVGYL